MQVGGEGGGGRLPSAPLPVVSPPVAWRGDAKLAVKICDPSSGTDAVRYMGRYIWLSRISTTLRRKSLGRSRGNCDSEIELE